MTYCLAVNGTDYCTQRLPKRREVKTILCQKYHFVCYESNVEYLRLHVGMYSVFLKHWLTVFPIEQFKFLTIKEYSENRLNTLNQVVHFLGLESYNKKATREISDMSKFNQNKNASLTMLPKTKILLDDFYRPYNQELAAMIGDDKFLFN